MTYKDCVHYEACKDMYGGYSCYFNDCNFAPGCIDVGLFKNKADFVDVKHGEWEHVYGNTYRCSECHSPAIVNIFHESSLSKFCPHCGADMKKEGADNDKR